MSHQWASGWLLFHANFSCSSQSDHNDKQITPPYLLLSSHHPFYNLTSSMIYPSKIDGVSGAWEAEKWQTSMHVQ